MPGQVEWMRRQLLKLAAFDVCERDPSAERRSQEPRLFRKATRMTSRKKAPSLLRAAATVAGLALPTLSLVPFGSVWLYQNGYLLHWALIMTSVMIAVYIWQRRLLKRHVPAHEPSHATEAASAASDRGVSEDWSAAERRAWQDVLILARNTDPAQLSSREALIAAGLRTIQAVARRLHPEVAEPEWQFTLPEALAITERVSRRLGAFALDHVPLVDRLTMARILSLYRWRSAIDVAEKAYDVWRVIRLANPMAAATNEVRERLSRDMLGWGRDHVMRKLSEAYIQEVGRAAIDLYGGRLIVGDQIVDDAPRPLESRPQVGRWRRLGTQSANAGKAVLRSFRRK